MHFHSLIQKKSSLNALRVYCVNTERLAQRDTIIQQASVPAAGRPRAQQHTVGLHYYGLTAHRIN